MSQQAISWASCDYLSCAGNVPSDVILCVTSDLIAQKVCPGAVPPRTTTDTSFVWQTIEATLVNASKSNSCGPKPWVYTFVYDDMQLANPLIPLAAADILGVFCGGCLKAYIDDRAGNDVYLRHNQDGTITLVNQHGCEYTFTPGGGG